MTWAQADFVEGDEVPEDRVAARLHRSRLRGGWLRRDKVATSGVGLALVEGVGVGVGEAKCAAGAWVQAANSRVAAINSRRVEGKRGSLSKVTGGPTTDSESGDDQGRPALLEHAGLGRRRNALTLRIRRDLQGVRARPTGHMPGDHEGLQSLNEFRLSPKTDNGKRDEILWAV